MYLLISLLLFWPATSFAQGTYFKWVDKDGKVHFSNAPSADAKGATPLQTRDQPENPRSTQARYVDEVGDQLTGLMNQAKVLIQSGSNSTANKPELRSIATQLEGTLKEYQNRANLVIAAEKNPIYRKAIVDASDTTRVRVKTYVDLIKKYVDAREVIDQAELNRLADEQKRARSKIVDDVRITLQSSEANWNSWRPYNNANRLVQVGMTEKQVEGIAGQPDKKEFYTGTREGRFVAIAGWYYVNSSRTQTALLEFEIGTESLIRIISRP